ncbi:hypothetical protein ACQ4M3_29195 [Leptolyngbya sp. AN03gr2]|uniref:hypothetical protein n=1 Tax=unclassified Leptolyngbya TaxID=2650499 RepID=UPI003D321B16
MGKFSRVSTSELFADAGQNQEIFNLKQQIESLQAEIIQLRAQDSAETKALLEEKIQFLTQELTNSEGISEIEFHRITRNPLQPRIIFPQAELVAFSNVLKAQGQLDPVILIRLTETMRENLMQYAKEGLFDPDQPHFSIDREFMLFDGERRWRSGESVMERLKAVIMPPQEFINLLEIQSQAASTTIHQKKLHDLEMARFLLSQVKFRFKALTQNLSDPLDIEIPRALNSAIYRLKQTQRIDELAEMVVETQTVQERWLSEVEIEDLGRAILSIILSFQLHPGNISRNVFSLLKLPEDLKQAAWNEGLDPKKLRILAKLKGSSLSVTEEEAAQIRLETTEKTIREKWSSSTLDQYVQKLIEQYNPSENDSPRLPKEFIALEASDLSTLEPDELKLCQQVLQRKLKQIKALLSQQPIHEAESIV